MLHTHIFAFYFSLFPFFTFIFTGKNVKEQSIFRTKNFFSVSRYFFEGLSKDLKQIQSTPGRWFFFPSYILNCHCDRKIKFVALIIPLHLYQTTKTNLSFFGSFAIFFLRLFFLLSGIKELHHYYCSGQNKWLISE